MIIKYNNFIKEEKMIITIDMIESLSMYKKEDVGDYLCELGDKIDALGEKVNICLYINDSLFIDRDGVLFNPITIYNAPVSLFSKINSSLLKKPIFGSKIDMSHIFYVIEYELHNYGNSNDNFKNIKETEKIVNSFLENDKRISTMFSIVDHGSPTRNVTITSSNIMSYICNVYDDTRYIIILEQR